MLYYTLELRDRPGYNFWPIRRPVHNRRNLVEVVSGVLYLFSTWTAIDKHPIESILGLGEYPRVLGLPKRDPCLGLKLALLLKSH